MRRSAGRSRLCWTVAAGRGSAWSGCRVWRLAGKRCKPARTARRDGQVDSERKDIAELWLRKWVERSGTGWSSRKPEASFRPQAGRHKYRAAEGTARFGRPWPIKGCRPWSSPAAGRRRLPSPMVGTVAACAVKAARPDAKAPGPGWGLERRPFVRSRRLRPAHSLRIAQSAVPATYHNPDGIMTK